MKKYIVLSLLSLLFCTASVSVVQAKNSTTPALASAIKLYKAGNYTESYATLKKVVVDEPANALAYYYLAMSAVQVGERAEAIENYNKVLSLAPSEKLANYATKGKVCIESPISCKDVGTKPSELDSFIQQSFGSGFSEKARSEYEKLKIENMMREMDRRNDIAPARFKEYKDFSSYNDIPSNEEIVTAFRILQRAGLSEFVNGSKDISELSLLSQSKVNGSNQLFDILGGGNNSTLNPQIIQALLTNQMTTGF